MTEHPLDVVDFADATDAADTKAAAQEVRSPIRRREFAALLIAVVAADLMIYRGEGYAGAGAFFVAATFALLLGARGQSKIGDLAWVLPLLLLLAAKLVWNGTELTVACGAALLVAAAMCLARQRPFVLECLLFASQTIPAGFIALGRYAVGLQPVRNRNGLRHSIAILLPAAVVTIFAVLFVLANPDLLSWVSEGWTEAVRKFRRWIVEFGPSPLEAAFWVGTAWLTAGLLRPLAGFRMLCQDERQRTTEPASRLEPAPLYAAYRNTLAGVVVLFAVYLAFEFATLWFREFEPGFYYSGYAHEGAAWLTVALALATLTLSVVFQGSTLRDPRLVTLRRWAAAWSIESLLLAVAVYHRMFIYIDFNGMTRMRVVGLLGISAVVAGLLLVLVKIGRSRSFVWLVRRDLWTLGLCIYLYAVLPVDSFVTWYNVRRIRAGDPAPSVQISVHPIRAEGLLMLRPLLDSEDPLIREGIRALLADRLREFDERRFRAPLHWTAWQGADFRLQQDLEELRPRLAEYEDPATSRAAREAFDRYAYQWY